MNRVGKLEEAEIVIGLLCFLVADCGARAGAVAVVLVSVLTGYFLGLKYRAYIIDQFLYVVVPAMVCAFLAQRRLNDYGIITHEARVYGLLSFLVILVVAWRESKNHINPPLPTEEEQDD